MVLALISLSGENNIEAFRSRTLKLSLGKRGDVTDTGVNGGAARLSAFCHSVPFFRHTKNPSPKYKSRYLDVYKLPGRKHINREVFLGVLH